MKVLSSYYIDRLMTMNNRFWTLCFLMAVMTRTTTSAYHYNSGFIIYEKYRSAARRNSPSLKFLPKKSKQARLYDRTFIGGCLFSYLDDLSSSSSSSSSSAAVDTSKRDVNNNNNPADFNRRSGSDNKRNDDQFQSSSLSSRQQQKQQQQQQQQQQPPIQDDIKMGSSPSSPAGSPPVVDSKDADDDIDKVIANSKKKVQDVLFNMKRKSTSDDSGDRGGRVENETMEFDGISNLHYVSNIRKDPIISEDGSDQDSSELELESESPFPTKESSGDDIMAVGEFDDGTKLYENIMKLKDEEEGTSTTTSKKNIDQSTPNIHIDIQMFQTTRYANEEDGISLEAFQRAKTREEFKQAKAKIPEETTQRWASSSSSSDSAEIDSATIDSEYNNNNNNNHYNRFDPWNHADMPFFLENNNKNNNGMTTIQPLGNGDTTTERMLKKVPNNDPVVGGVLGGYSNLDAFKQAEAEWAKLKAFKPFYYDQEWLRWSQNGNIPAPQFVSTDGAFGNPACWSKLKQSINKALDYDVVVAGGTFGIFYAAYLQRRGYKVCVVEAGPLRGREQEWNTNLDQLYQLVDYGIIGESDIIHIINSASQKADRKGESSRNNNIAGGPKSFGYESPTSDNLNVAVSPALLIARVSERFLERGGTVIDRTRVNGICISELVGCAIDLGIETEPITAKLVLDCMGNSSPITAQQRYGVKPDGICAVVGSFAKGYGSQNSTDANDKNPATAKKEKKMIKKGTNQKYFWESFPANSQQSESAAKTTYMYTYMNVNEKRPSLLDLMEDYWKLLPEYQKSINNPETDLDVQRIFFAYYPTFRDSPLKTQFSRVLPCGDASGIQSPLSFRGFGSVTRHLGRVGGAVCDALDKGCLHKNDLQEINTYQPNLSASWLYQKGAMSRMNVRPFPQDDVRFDLLADHFFADPFFMPKVIGTAGIQEVSTWLGHVGNMAKYSVLDAAAAPVVGTVVNRLMNGKPREQFRWRRRMEAWKYGCGADYSKRRKKKAEQDRKQ